jgi:hypothetical protein
VERRRRRTRDDWPGRQVQAPAPPPGAYVVAVTRKLPIGGSQPMAALVRMGRFTSVRLAIDTGIR